MKRKLLLILIYCFIAGSSFASHMMGGEITWTCLGSGPNSGKYIFTMKFYRDCNGIPGPSGTEPLTVHNYPSIGQQTTFTMNVISQTDITPCQPVNNCVNGGPGAVEEFILQTAPITLTGVPPVQGWIFSWQSCCRNAALDNIPPNGQTLRAIMYPYNGQNASPCYDNSPYFVEPPQTIICTGYPYTYNHNVADQELDSLIYEWGDPLDQWASGTWSASNPAPLPWNAGFSKTSPLPDASFNPSNVPVTLDPYSGEMKFWCFTQGHYVTCIKVTAYKCGQKVAEIFREIQVALLACPPTVSGTTNYPPSVTPPFKDPAGNFTLYSDTVTAGDSVFFQLSASDFDLNDSLHKQPNGTIVVVPYGQYIEFNGGVGGEFGAGFSNPNAGCLIPPCAITVPPLPTGGTVGASVKFGWKTDCVHLGAVSGCANISNVYRFVIRCQDDFCKSGSAPAISVSTITIVINQPPKVDSSVVRCVSVLPNGDLQLTWCKPKDEALPNDTAISFKKYMIYHSVNPNGPFTVLDSLENINDTTYVHLGANAPSQSHYYCLTTKYACAASFETGFTDTVTYINVGVSNAIPGTASVSWNPIRNPLLLTSSSKYYYVYREQPLGTWTFLDSTSALFYNDTTVDNFCSDTINYMVTIADSIGCVSLSSIGGNNFNNTKPPEEPSLRCVAVSTNGNVTTSWKAPVDTGFSFDGYYIYQSTGGGPFTLIDSISAYNTTSYSSTSANGNAGSVKYYVESRTACQRKYSNPSDTLKTIYLTVGGAGTLTANLNWNAIRTPNLPTSYGQYVVFRKIRSVGTWINIATVATTNYIDNLSLCIDSVFYRIEIQDSLPCNSVSNEAGNLFIDNSIPDPPSLRCVSVAANGDVVMNWLSPTDTARLFNSYHIYTSNTGLPGSYSLIDSLFSYNATGYTHAGANANNGSVYYTIKSRSGCGVQYSEGSDTLRTIYLTVGGAGTSTANLSWNASRNPNLTTSFGQYNIFRNYNHGGWSQIGTVAGTTYADPLVVCIDSVFYRIEIQDSLPCTSVSNVAGNQFVDNSIPDPPSLRCVAVQANGDAVLSWEQPADTARSFNSYHIFSSTTGGAGTYTVIDSLFSFNSSSYTHVGANANAGSVYYSIETRSGCGVQYSEGSDTLQSIYLSVAGGGTDKAQLSWNPLHTPDLPTSYGQYHIFKEYPAGVWKSLAVTTATSYVDSLNICIDPINYRIEISDSLPCNSVSNVNGNTFMDNSIPEGPSLRCAEVLPNGDVTLTWVPPLDTAHQFNSYHIYVINGAGALVEIDSVFNYSATSYTHIGANAQVASVRYVVKTRSGCGPQYSLPSDTLKTIKVAVTNTGNGVAKISWNPLRVPDLPSSLGVYAVFREYPAGVWIQIGSTPQLTYYDTINLCSATINYKVTIGDASGCTSVSSVDGDLFHDIIPPTIPVLDTVSVSPVDTNVTISWFTDPAGDTKGYIIYLFNSAASSWDSIGFTSDINDVYMIYTASQADQKSEQYAVAAYDSCNNLSALSVNHQTIFLKAKLDKCAATINLSWNRYINMQGEVNAYRIYASENGGAFDLIATVSDVTTTYSHKDLNQYSTYCYVVTAVGNTASRTATSNTDCEFADILKLPKFSYVKKASVIAYHQVLVQCYVDTAADVSYYKLQRSLNPFGPFETILSSTDTLNTVISFLDTTAKTDESSYYYRVVSVSNCNQEVLTSNRAKTIFLSAVPNDNLTNTVKWNDYEGWLGSIDRYDLYRTVVGTAGYSKIATLPYGMNEYLDNVADFYKSNGVFCYYVNAFEGPGNTYGFTDTVSSNEGCAIQAPHLYVPTAFTPGGLNPVFVPMSVFTDVSKYSFSVFDRWGKIIFKTGDPFEGWDGTVDGKLAAQGTYVYHVELTGFDGQDLEKSGWVNLLR